MGRYIEQGKYKTNNYWSGNEANNPQTALARENDQKNAIYSQHLYKKRTILIDYENYLLNTGFDQIIMNLSPFMESVTFKGSEYLYNPGDTIKYVYFPETAVISEFQILEDGRTVEIAMTGKEGILGFMPLLKSYSPNNWTQVFVPGKAYRLSAQIFEREIAKNPKLQTIIFDYIGEYIKQISQRSVCNSYHTIEQRFCTWLLMIQSRKGGNRLPLTQEQIARSLGVHRPSVTHIAQNLRERKIIDYIRGKIIISDPEKLKETACDCYLEIDGNLRNISNNFKSVM
ncbi:MAG: Crp/Fnr family transcriptional regulator [Pyrinomonadaceae bacterium]|nr:Crp/Fnr family transcriptional regulator [Pyrinomonadaceae bacterium]